MCEIRIGDAGVNFEQLPLEYAGFNINYLVTASILYKYS